MEFSGVSPSSIPISKIATNITENNNMHNEEAQVEMHNNITEYEVVSGRRFSLTNKETGDREDVFIPFDLHINLNNRIAETANVLYVGTGKECFEFAVQRKLAHKGNLASAYILGDGRCVLMRPHTHDNTARIVLPRAMVPDTHIYDKEFVLRVNAHLMPLYARAIRVQMYPNGIGVSVDMLMPPNLEQLQSIREYYESTTGDVFVAEMRYNLKMIGRVRGWDEFHEYITVQQTKTFANFLMHIQASSL